jgi:hypothetical protein
MFSFCSHDGRASDGQLHALGLIEKLRDDLRAFDGAKDELYHRIQRALRELADPNLHDVNLVTAFKIELWDRYGRDHLRMVVAATSSIAIAHAAFDAAVVQYNGERLTLRKGAMVLRENGNVEPSSSVTR